jgi:hypothetical protein
LPLALGAVVLIAVVWGGIRLFGGDPSSQPAAEVASASPDASRGEQSTASSGLPSQRAPGAAESHANDDSRAAAGAQTPANAKSATGAKLPTNARASLNGKLASKTPLPAGAATAHSAGIQEVLPDVPPRARRTIRGNVKVSVRVIVEQDGSVFAALAEHRGPSRYFERLAIDAAKQWTFPPAESADQRLMLVKFAFNREGTTAEAVAVN